MYAPEVGRRESGAGEEYELRD
uniref:Uncharacterized protein n=1 Tax=Rhizophora mucronata TaxID=61149 RepID=A0A2P2P9G5_RHIMU